MKSSVWLAVNTIYLALLFISGLVWIVQLNTFSSVVGLASVVFAFFLYKKQRWAYFAAAVLCFGLLRIAMDDGHNFYQGYQSFVKVPYLAGIVIAIILHEKVAKKSASSHP